MKKVVRTLAEDEDLQRILKAERGLFAGMRKAQIEGLGVAENP